MSGYRIKPWEELTISDDYMFKLIMSRKRICKQRYFSTRRGDLARSTIPFVRFCSTSTA